MLELQAVCVDWWMALTAAGSSACSFYMRASAANRASPSSFVPSFVEGRGGGPPRAPPRLSRRSADGPVQSEPCGPGKLLGVSFQTD